MDYCARNALHIITGRLINNGLAIIPKLNQISNIGYGPDSTHTNNKNAKSAELPLYTLEFPLSHPKCIMPDIKYDNAFTKCLTENWSQLLLANLKQRISR